MFRTAFVRRLATVMSVALLATLAAAPSASAIVPPPGGGPYYSCGSIPAGFVPNTGGGASAWIFDGRLTWEWCIARTTSGSHYAIARLTSPGPTQLSGNYDKTWAVLTIRLQDCTSYTYPARVAWSPNYAVGGLIGSRYYWPWQQTGSTSSSTKTYRVYIEGSGYVFRDNLSGWYFSFGPGPYPPSPASYWIYVGPCVTP